MMMYSLLLALDGVILALQLLQFAVTTSIFSSLANRIEKLEDKE